MEFETNKWYIYKKYGVDTYIPMLWGENILQFDTKEAAEDFMAVAHRELGLIWTRLYMTTLLGLIPSIRFLMRPFIGLNPAWVGMIICVILERVKL